jgi:hypothetical protein
MTDHPDLADIYEKYLTFLEDGGPEPDLAGLPPDLREEVERQFALLHQGFGVLAGMPDIADDPVFAALGFDRLGTHVDIAGSKLSSVRKRSKLNYAEIVERLQNAGCDLAVRDLFRMEQATSTMLPQPDAMALAAALRVSLAELESTGAQVGRIQKFLNSDEFHDAMRRWSETTGGDLEGGVRQARRDLAGANFRQAQHSDFADLVELLEAVLERWADGDHQEPR